MIEMQAPFFPNSGYSLRQCILEDYKEDLPISGGWGYTKDDAIIIAPYKAYVSLEYYVAKLRLYEELIICRRKDDRYAGIRWNAPRQYLKEIDGRFYDLLEYDVTCHREMDWFALKDEFESNDGFANDPVRKKEHLEMHEALKHHFKTSFWFDITECFGKDDLPMFIKKETAQK